LDSLRTLLAAASSSRPKGTRLGPRRGLGERRGEQAQRGRREDGTAEALQRPGRDQLAAVLGEAAEEAGRGEDDQTDEEDLLAAEQVSRAAAAEQEARERQRVGVEDPGEAGVTEVERGLQVGQRHVHDGDVEHHHELGRAADGEDPALGLAAGRCC
jgi:hypothetical protein